MISQQIHSRAFVWSAVKEDDPLKGGPYITMSWRTENPFDGTSSTTIFFPTLRARDEWLRMIANALGKDLKERTDDPNALPY